MDLTLLVFFSRFFKPKYAFFSSLCSGSKWRPFWKCLDNIEKKNPLKKDNSSEKKFVTHD